jgi:hypothetical protein
MSIHLYPYDLPAFADVSVLQWNGQECVYCPSGHVCASRGVMIPVGFIHGSQIFAHGECAAEHQWEES